MSKKNPSDEKPIEIFRLVSSKPLTTRERKIFNIALQLGKSAFRHWVNISAPCFVNNNETHIHSVYCMLEHSTDHPFASAFINKDFPITLSDDEDANGETL